MPAAGVECGVVRVPAADDLRNPDHRRLRDIAVIEQHLVPGLDRITQVVARLVVAHPVPRFGHAGPVVQIIDGEAARFAFEEPVGHGHSFPALTRMSPEIASRHKYFLRLRSYSNSALSSSIVRRRAAISVRSVETSPSSLSSRSFPAVTRCRAGPGGGAGVSAGNSGSPA